jgi:hypothetical protein
MCVHLARDLIINPIIYYYNSNSFGYDCNKRSNLYLIDPETLMFSAGNLVVMLNIKTKQQKYLRTLSGGAVGAIAVIINN